MNIKIERESLMFSVHLTLSHVSLLKVQTICTYISITLSQHERPSLLFEGGGVRDCTINSILVFPGQFLQLFFGYVIRIYLYIF